jgi:hypothetical protein
MSFTSLSESSSSRSMVRLTGVSCEIQRHDVTTQFISPTQTAVKISNLKHVEIVFFVRRLKSSCVHCVRRSFYARVSGLTNVLCILREKNTLFLLPFSYV